jgi:hypothetical protein
MKHFHLISLRRQALAAALAVYALAPGSSPAQGSATVYVRKDVSKPEAQADLAALNTGIGKMKELKCGDPTGWYYQGAIHWVPDDRIDGSKLGEGNKLCPDYKGTKDTRKDAWDNCTHTPNSELHFLVWHRLFIYYLEDIVRAKSGKADFALPYWNYVDPKKGKLPALFIDKKSNLYEEARNAVLTQGKPIEAYMYKPGGHLDLTKLMTHKTYKRFNETMDASPHGAMHGYIGGGVDNEKLFNRIYQTTLVDPDTGAGQGGVMAHVPSAGFDPIFWLHHAEIDHIWQEWMNSPNGRKPHLADLQKEPIRYDFFDRNGKKVKLSVEDAYKLAFSLPVTYDSVKPNILLTQASPVKTDEAAPSPAAVASVAAPQVVKGRETSFSAKLDVKSEAKSLLLAGPADRRVILHLKVSFAKEPSGIYEVYVRNEAGKKLEGAEQLAGHMTFFGAALHATHGTDHGAGHKLTKDFNFDVTDQVNLKKFDGKLDVRIVKEGDPKDADALSVEQQDIFLE